MKRYLFAALLAVSVAGCVPVTRTEGTRIDSSKVTDIKPGVTTREQVLQTFGSPTEVTFDNNEERMVYVFKERRVPTIGGVVENEFTSTEKKTSLELVFRNNVVQTYRFKSSVN